MKDYKDLEVWKKSMDLVVDIYKLIKQLPKEETYALSDQIRRSAVFIPSNIAEGASRKSTKEFVNFLYITLGSSSELETQLILAREIGYVNNENLKQILADLIIIRKMIHSLINYLRGKQK
ncbi:MAG: four helix bundle protein [Deltaproteobacteria bacterium]|nr:four helix bundle protein [Deltaproteobacteria bacterium]